MVDAVEKNFEEEPEVPVVTRLAQYAGKANKKGVEDEEVFGGITPDNPTQPSEQNIKQQHASSKKVSEPQQHPTVRALGHLLDDSPPGAHPEPAEPESPGECDEGRRRLTFEEATHLKMMNAMAWEARCMHFQRCYL